MLIITSPLNSHETITLLNQLSGYNRSKILIIDIIGNIFNKQHAFYKTINHHKKEWLASNLLVLTSLTGRLKRFLNATFTTEFHNIYGNGHDETIHSALEPLKSMAVSESWVINLLAKRLNGYGQQRDAYNSDDNILVHFNKTELNLIASVFEKLLNNDSCRTMGSAHSRQAAESVSNVASSTDVHQQPNKMAKLANATRADGGVNETLLTCAPNNNSLSKCETFLREKASMLQPNSTRTLDITKVLCKQIQLWLQYNAEPNLKQGEEEQQLVQHHKSNRVPNFLNRIVNSLGKNRTTTDAGADPIDRNANDTNTNLISATSKEFVNLIPNQVDATFSEYLPFFDFILTKLALSHNLTVNYNNQSGGFATATPNGTASTTAGDTFDFCILELGLNQTSVDSYDRDNDDTDPINSSNYTDAPFDPTYISSAFVWRPVLILRQSELHQNIFVTHPLLSVGYHSWFFDNTHKFWTCGLLCWILAGIVILLLVCILVASITLGLAIR